MKTIYVILVVFFCFIAVACSTANQQTEGIVEVSMPTTEEVVPPQLRGSTVLVIFTGFAVNPDPALGEALQAVTGQPVTKIMYGYAAKVPRMNLYSFSVPSNAGVRYVYSQGGELWSISGDKGEIMLSVSDEQAAAFYAE